MNRHTKRAIIAALVTVGALPLGAKLISDFPKPAIIGVAKPGLILPKKNPLIPNIASLPLLGAGLGVDAAGGGGGAMTFVTSATGNSAGAGTVNTISSLSLGTAINGRLCVAVITVEFALSASITYTSCTIGGVSATLAGFDGQQGTTTAHTLICAAILNSGAPTSGDVVLTTSHTMGAAVMCTVLTFDNANSATVVEDQKPTAETDNTTRTLNVTAGGVVVAAYNGANPANACTPTGMTEVYDAADSTNAWRHCVYYDLQASTGTDTMSLDSSSVSNREQYASYR